MLYSIKMKGLVSSTLLFEDQRKNKRTGTQFVNTTPSWYFYLLILLFVALVFVNITTYLLILPFVDTSSICKYYLLILLVFVNKFLPSFWRRRIFPCPTSPARTRWPWRSTYRKSFWAIFRQSWGRCKTEKVTYVNKNTHRATRLALKHSLEKGSFETSLTRFMKVSFKNVLVYRCR